MSGSNMMPEQTKRQAARVEYYTKLRQQSKERFEQENAAMAKIQTQTMTTFLPEGSGYFTVTWPETITPAEVDMCEELFKLQWDGVRRWVAERENELDAALKSAGEEST